VAFFQSEGRYVKLVGTDNHRYIVDGTMDKIAAELDPRHFFRINRQLIVSFAAITSMVPYSKSRVKVLLHPQPDADSIVSVERSAEFKAWLDR
jgi:DNA-binding LytR/AlgR family response regulator